jgi:putative addiction module component (TIGR02574 family)
MGVSLAEILRLDVAGRLRLVQMIWDGIADAPDAVPMTDAGRVELDRRLEEHLRDPQAGSPWQDVKARIARGR